MSLFYQVHDFEFCDYELHRLNGVPGMLRGPRPPDMAQIGRMLSALGAAQTFGTMCKYPFPTLLGSMLGRDVLNFGVGGAGPSNFLTPQYRTVLEYVNRSRVCIVQVMSGRSEANALMSNPAGGHLLRWRNDPADTPLRSADDLYRELIERHDQDTVREIVQETRANWVSGYRALAAEIAVPKILLWISTRNPDYPESLSSVGGLFGRFPQMVNADMLESIAGCFDGLAIAVSTNGSPAPLWSRFTGLPIKVKRNAVTFEVNQYYPSQQLHMLAAQQLEPFVARYL